MVKMSIIFTIVIYLHCHTRGWHHYVLLCMNYMLYQRDLCLSERYR